uniref:glucuronosyltransferase n=1 Tax=Bursaphelenchus xylophilus TaxID=6326 RepID=A0A1I7RYM5_BURXY
MRSLAALLIQFSFASGLKFLLYNPDNPGASKSHVILVDKLGDLLVNAGHEVVTYMPYVNEVSFANFTRKSDLLLYKVSMDVPKFAQNTNIWLRDFEVTEIAAWMKQLGDVATRSCKIQLEDEALMQRLRDENFDFGLVEYFDPCGVGIFHKIGLKRYSMVYSTQIHLTHARYVGIPTPTSFVPENTWTSASKMTFMQRVWNFLANVIVEPYVISSHISGFNEIFNPMGKTVYDLMAEGGYIFINTDEFVDFPKPISHKVVNIGGIGMKKLLSIPQRLPAEYQKVFDTAKKGVVLISFGSLARTVDIPMKSRKALFEAFRHFPEINFVVKYEDKDHKPLELPSNVFLAEWLPQPAILGEIFC